MTPTAFVINLAGSEGRLASARGALATLGLPWTRVEAVDGRGRDPRTFDAYDDAAARRYMGRSMTGGEVACHLSHAAAARAFLATDARFGLILEDDFHLRPGAVEAFAPVMGWLASDAAPAWEVVNIGAHRNKIATRVGRVAGRDVMAAHYFPMLATAILWSRPAAEAFADGSARILRPADNELRHRQTRSGRGLSVWPPLVGAGLHASDIDARTRRTDKDARDRLYGWRKQRRLWDDKLRAGIWKLRWRLNG